MRNLTGMAHPPCTDSRRALAARGLLGLALGLMLATVSYAADEAVDQLLARDEPPAGVVFEVVENDENALETVLPTLERHAERLQERFGEDLHLVLVSHGNEQFTLTREAEAERGDLHDQLGELMGERRMDVEVCATYASWRDVAPEAFPETVEVAESAPARINDYRELGYEVIRLRPPQPETEPDPLEF